MINATFRLGGDMVSIKIENNNLFFFDIGTGQISTIEGIRISKAGVLKEHPDLKDEIEWRKIAIERLKKHVKEFNTELEKIYYVKDELVKWGYTPVNYAKKGFRPEKFQEEI